MQEFLTAVWLEAAYQEFRRMRGTKLDRPAWFRACRRAGKFLMGRRAYN
jgi:hypothetical protein